MTRTIKNPRHGPIFLCWTVLLGSAAAVPQQQDSRQARQEEGEDYFKKWLDETVTYIISQEERKVFEGLANEEERDQFIEQFWLRRDPDPRTAVNEYKEEHFHRIAQANERFSSGKPGWMTDRGRIFIIHGPPDEVESHPAGGHYRRGLRQGGGETAAYPYEIWRYRHIEGIGSDVDLEFIDPTLSDQYRLALDPSEKDALLHAGGGATLLEELELSDGRGRFSSHTQRGFYWREDNPFERYRIFSQVQAPQVVKYKDLQQLVQVDVSFEDLPLQARGDFFRLDQERVLAPLTLQVENKDLTFQLKNGVHLARLAVYGVVTSLTKRVVAEFEDDLQLSYRPADLQAGLARSSIYQKVVPLQARMRYRLDLVVKDLHSGKVGILRQALVPSEFPQDRLAFSSLLISDSVQVLEEIPSGNPMFVLGDVKIRPNLSQSFPAGSSLQVYFQLYNAAISSDTQEPALAFRYRILQGNRLLSRLDDLGQVSIQMASPQRVVALKSLAVEGLQPGKYTLEVEVEDQISRQSASARQPFRILKAP